MAMDLLLTEGARVLSRLTSTTAVRGGYRKMLEAEDLSVNEQVFVNSEIAVLEDEMDRLSRRLQQLCKPLPETPATPQ